MIYERIFCLILKFIQGISVRLANIEFTKAKYLSSGNRSSYDIYKAHFLSKYIEGNSRILDIGCGNGWLLDHLSLFKKYDCYGVDIQKSCVFPHIKFSLFDGKHLPFQNNKFDSSILSHVLHHLDNESITQLINETIKVTTSSILIFEDTMEHFSFFYKIRNWCHFKESSLSYRKKSRGIYASPRGKLIFLTFREWREFFQKFTAIKEIHFFPLKKIGAAKYKHHTLIRLVL